MPIPGLGRAAQSPSRAILLVSAAGLALGLAAFAAWLLSRDTRWLTLFFQGPSIFWMIGLAVLQTWLGFRVRNLFLPDEPLRAAWTLIAFSAACDLLSAICVQWLGSPSPLNVLARASWWFPGATEEMRQFGLGFATYRYGLLAAGLFYVLRIYRRAGFLARLKPVDWILVALVIAYVLNETALTVRAFRQGKEFHWTEAMSWPVSPLLAFLLYESRVMARSVQSMGAGTIGRCWSAFSIGILLVWIGDLFFQAGSYRSWEWASLGWYVWLPAAGAFALAPAFQMEAIALEMNERISVAEA